MSAVERLLGHSSFTSSMISATEELKCQRDFEIIGHALERLVRPADEQLFLGGGAGEIGLRVEIDLDVAQAIGVFVDQPIDAVQKARRAFDALLAPFQVFFRRRRKQRVHAAGIAAVFFGHIDRADHIAARLGHGHAALLHHALREQPRDRFAVIHEAEVVHHFAEKPRIEQVQNGVFDAADVLVNREPIAPTFSLSKGA